MQIASMFASLGFKVDTSGLDKFKRSLSNARQEFTNLNQSVKQTSKHLRSLKSALDSVDRSLNRVRGGGANTRIITSYRDMANAVRGVDTNLQSITTHQPNTTKAIGKINSSVHAGVKYWQDYANAVKQARDALRQVRSRVNELQHNRNINININERRRNIGGGGGGGGGGDGLPLPLILGGAGGVAAFFRSILPSFALVGGLTSLGYGAQQVVTSGREQTKMENVLQFSSKNLDEFNDSLKFVKATALELGVSSKELGTAFAQISMSAGTSLSSDEKKSMFKDMSAVFATMGADKDEQFLLFKAVNQMFSLGRVQAEEMNQLTGQGLVPRQAVYQAVRDTYGKNLTNKDIAKLQKANELDPKRFIPRLFGNLRNQAESSGALDKYKNSSQFQQGKLRESFKQLSKEIMDSSLDSFLASILGLLTKLTDSLIPLVKELRPFTDGVKEISKSISKTKAIIDDWIVRNGALLSNIAKIGGKTAIYASILGIVAGKMGLAVSVGGRLSSFLAGIFSSRIVAVVGKLGIWAIVIWGVIKAVSFLGKQLRMGEQGKWTFFDEMFAKIQIVGLEIEQLMLKFNLLATKIGFDNFVIRNVKNLGDKAKSWFSPSSSKPKPTQTPVPPTQIPYKIPNSYNMIGKGLPNSQKPISANVVIKNVTVTGNTATAPNAMITIRGITP